MAGVRLDGKTALVTGANTGIGRETARELANRGARVILACRSEQRGEEAKQDIIKTTAHTNVHLYKLDLASLASVRAFAEKFNNNEDRLDLLINNAGVLTRERSTTVDGFETMFGVNHLGHFLLTYLLLDKLKSSAPSRVVCVSSMGHERAPIDFSDLQSERKFVLLQAYGRTKTANVLFAVHLAKLLDGTGVTTYSLHPGVIETELARDFSGSCFICCFNCFWKYCLCRSVLTSTEGAETTLYCALQPSIAKHSGRYYSDSKEKRAKSHATDPEKARKLWEASLQLCGLPQES